MGESQAVDRDVEQEDLLDGQPVFKGPRKLVKFFNKLLSGGSSNSDDE